MKECKVSKAWSIGSLSCGIAGLVLFLAPYFGIVLSILAMIFYSQDKESGLAKGGLVTGIIGTVVNSMMLLFIFVFFVLFPEMLV